MDWFMGSQKCCTESTPKSNFVAGFPFDTAEQYCSQLKTANNISEGIAGKPKENAADY